MPLVQTRGAASAQGFGEFAQVTIPNYIEEVFSTYLYTGTGAAQTITNGIDLSTNGGLVWIKMRSPDPLPHILLDTARGIANGLSSDDNGAQFSTVNRLNSVNVDGFTVSTGNSVSSNGGKFVSWTFRKQPKFFDIVTYTGNGTARSIAHSLGSAPGCVIIKSTSGTGLWAVWHRSGTQQNRYSAFLNLTDAYSNQGSSYWGTPLTDAPDMNASTFSVGTVADVNGSGVSYVAYIFAHNAGGFGLTGTDNVISCGSFTTDGSGNATVSLGYEPQWLLTKQSSGGGGQDWYLVDNMRPWSLDTGTDVALRPNLANADYAGDYGFPTATGFYQTGLNASATHIYIAIRRGPMKVPTLGTSVFYPTTYTGTGSARTFSGFGFPPDFEMSISTGGSAAGDNNGPEIYDRLRGPTVRLLTPSTDAEFTTTDVITMLQDGISVSATTNSYINANGFAKVLYGFRRAPSFFDEVCYTGTGASATFNHNLTVTPEIIIIKNRSNAQNWGFWHKDLYPTYASSAILFLNNTSTAGAGYMGTPTSSTFSFATGNGIVNASGNTYVAYLFATCAGVSKVGTYTGNGTTQTIDCGFTGGARFVLIRRIDTSGDWYVYDTARGMSVLTDPYFWLNSTAAEVATLGSVTTVSTGFALNSAITAAINISAGTYIFLAIA